MAIENDKQLEISKERIKGFELMIQRHKKDKRGGLLRKTLTLAPIINHLEELKKEVEEYEFRRRQRYPIRNKAEYKNAIARYEKVRTAKKGTIDHEEKMLLVLLISNYESKKDKPVYLSEIPKMIKDFRVSKGLTQKELAGKLKMKEQQIQQYERTKYKGVSFAKLIQILSCMNINLTIK